MFISGIFDMQCLMENFALCFKIIGEKPSFTFQLRRKWDLIIKTVLSRELLQNRRINLCQTTVPYFLTHIIHIFCQNQHPKIGVHDLSGDVVFFTDKGTLLETPASRSAARTAAAASLLSKLKGQNLVLTPRGHSFWLSTVVCARSSK